MRSTTADDYQHLPRAVTVMVKSFDAGASTDRHAHPRAQLLYATSGLMFAHTDAGAWAVPADHALLIPPGLQHEIVMHGPVRMQTAYITADASPAFKPGTCIVIRVSKLLDATLTALASEPVLYATQGRSGHLAALVLDEINRAETAPLVLPMPSDRRLKRLCQTLIDQPDLAQGLDDWAFDLGISRRTLTRRFRNETGLSFAAWRRRLRILNAMISQAEGLSFAETARKAGYQSPRAFKAMISRGG